jgi:protoporphyrin/coproporphyrin ferrochelatase
MVDGLLLLGHGSPSSIEDIPQFLTNIRRGRSAPPELIAEVQRRYAAVGGGSPLLQTTQRQADLLAARMAMRCWIGMRMWRPYLHETLADAATQGVERLYAIVMAPHSAEVYEAALRERATKLEDDGVRVPRLWVAPSIGSEPALIECYAELARAQLLQIGANERSRTLLVPCAHSLPMSTVRSGDPYPNLVRQTAQAVISCLGEDAPRSMLAFQSQGLAGGEWLGPDLPTVLQHAKNTGAVGVLLLPIGFLVDHVETLYDLDIEARELTTRLGLSFHRSPCPNTHEGLISALQAVAHRLIASASSASKPCPET